MKCVVKKSNVLDEARLEFKYLECIKEIIDSNSIDVKLKMV